MLEVVGQVAKKLAELALTHPEAVDAIGHAVTNIASSSNPVEAARRAALVTASAEASELALKKILG